MSPDTYKDRLRQYKRRESLTIWVGAGLAGFIALLTGDVLVNILRDAPPWLSALLVTSIVAGGSALGLARVKFEWAATTIQRKVADRTVSTGDSIPSDDEWPKSAEGWWMASLWCLVVAGVLMIIGVWWVYLGRWWEYLTKIASRLVEAAPAIRGSPTMTTEVFAASDLHRLMFGLLYPAVLGTLFFSLLPELARILTQLAQKRTGGEEEKSARIKTVAGCLIVLHFVVDFQLTSSIPDQSYKVLGFIVDLVILFVLFLAFDASNV